jgi:hypothetical protein
MPAAVAGDSTAVWFIQGGGWKVRGGLVEAELRDAVGEAEGLWGPSPSADAAGASCHGRGEAAEEHARLRWWRWEGEKRCGFLILLLFHFLRREVEVGQ